MTINGYNGGISPPGLFRILVGANGHSPLHGHSPLQHGGNTLTTSLKHYLTSLENALKAGNATEHTHRPALKALQQTISLMAQIEQAVPHWPLG